MPACRSVTLWFYVSSQKTCINTECICESDLWLSGSMCHHRRHVSIQSVYVSQICDSLVLCVITEDMYQYRVYMWVRSVTLWFYVSSQKTCINTECICESDLWLSGSMCHHRRHVSIQSVYVSQICDSLVLCVITEDMYQYRVYMWVRSVTLWFYVSSQKTCINTECICESDLWLSGSMCHHRRHVSIQSVYVSQICDSLVLCVITEDMYQYRVYMWVRSVTLWCYVSSQKTCINTECICESASTPPYPVGLISWDVIDNSWPYWTAPIHIGINSTNHENSWIMTIRQNT